MKHWKPDTPFSSIQAEEIRALREIIFQLPRLTPGLTVSRARQVRARQRATRAQVVLSMTFAEPSS